MARRKRKIKSVQWRNISAAEKIWEVTLRVLGFWVAERFLLAARGERKEGTSARARKKEGRKEGILFCVRERVRVTGDDEERKKNHSLA